jgi:hypothetical protein
MSLIRAFVLLLPVIVVAALPVEAQTGATRMARFEGTTVIARAETHANVAIDLLRWSTEEEQTSLTEALAGGPASVADLLADAATVGYVWTAESVGYSIRFASRIPTDGGERIILALNDRFATRNPTLWTAQPPEDQAYTLIELRVDGQGRGEGRDVMPTAMAYAFGLDGFAAAAPLLENMSRIN